MSIHKSLLTSLAILAMAGCSEKPSESTQLTLPEKDGVLILHNNKSADTGYSYSLDLQKPDGKLLHAQLPPLAGSPRLKISWFRGDEFGHFLKFQHGADDRHDIDILNTTSGALLNSKGNPAAFDQTMSDVKKSAAVCLGYLDNERQFHATEHSKTNNDDQRVEEEERDRERAKWVRE